MGRYDKKKKGSTGRSSQEKWDLFQQGFTGQTKEQLEKSRKEKKKNKGSNRFLNLFDRFKNIEKD